MFCVKFKDGKGQLNFPHLLLFFEFVLLLFKLFEESFEI